MLRLFLPTSVTLKVLVRKIARTMILDTISLVLFPKIFAIFFFANCPQPPDTQNAGQLRILSS
jgi:hypothetical protein